MKKYLSVFTIFLFNITAQAALEIPEDCHLRSITPCLIRAQNPADSIRFGNFKLQLTKDAIVRISSVISLATQEKNDVEKSKSTMFDFAIIEGGARIVPDDEQKEYRVSEKPMVGESFAIRGLEKFDILKINGMVLVKYKTIFDPKPKDRELYKYKVTKKDFAYFVKPFFDEIEDLRTFLFVIHKNWNSLITIKNKKQDSTKVVVRGIASESDAFDVSEDQEKLNEVEIKKVRDMFFSRTFHR